MFSPTLLNELQLSGAPLADPLRHAGRQHQLGQQAGTAEPVRRDRLADHLRAATDDPFSNMLYYGGWDGDNNHNQNLTSFQIDDNVTWIKGKHTVKFGFKGRQEYNNVEELQQAEGSHSFYADWTQLYDPRRRRPRLSRARVSPSLLLGLPTYLCNQYNRGYFYFQQKEFGPYVNDTWKVTPTADHRTGTALGPLESVPREVRPPGQFGSGEPYADSRLSLRMAPRSIASRIFRREFWHPGRRAAYRGQTANSRVGFPSALIPQYWKDFGPRLALAYQNQRQMGFARRLRHVSIGPCRSPRSCRPPGPIRR